MSLDEALVRAFVAEGSDLDSKRVIEGNAKLAPNVLHASVLLISDEQVGYPVEVARDALSGGSSLDIAISRLAVFDIQWYYPGAIAAAQRFSVWAGSSIAVQKALESGFALQRYGQLRRLDDIIADAWEERVGIEFEVSYWAEEHFSSESIESLEADIAGVGGGQRIEVP